MSVPKECACVIPNSSAKQCDRLSHARPAPFPFSLFLFPDENTFTIEIEDRRAPKSLVLVYFSNKFLIFFVKVCIFYDFLGVKTKHLHPLHKVTISVWYMKSATFYLSGFNWQKSIQNLQKKCQLKWLRRSFFLAKANQVSTKKEFFEFRNFFLQHSRIQNPDLDPQIRIKLERILSTETQSAKKGII